VLLVLVAGCRPEVGPRSSLVTATRVVAATAEPAEANPGQAVHWVPLVVSPAGPATPEVDWSLCRTPKPFTIDDVIAPACLGAGSIGLGRSAELTSILPSDACRLFGPDLPPAGADGQKVRPRDPDASGGFYQPLILKLDGDDTVALERVRCALVGASAEEAAAFAARYVPNQNPAFTSVELTQYGAPTVPDSVPGDAAITITPQLTPAETYAHFEPATGVVSDEMETLVVSYFATAGTFDRDRDDGSSNVWRAPSAPTQVTMWLVARDSRGGSAFTTITLLIR